MTSIKCPLRSAELNTMSSVPAALPGPKALRRQRRRAEHGRANAAVRVTYGVLVLAMVGYWISVIARGGQYSEAIDGWAVAGVELLTCAMCILCGFLRPSVRPIAFCLGAALTCWALGDMILAAESIGGRTPSLPSFADLFYLSFYPLAYVAVFLFVKGQLKEVSGLGWLDGAIGALGAAALCGSLAFHKLVTEAGTSTLGTATNLAYPVGDLLLLGLVVGTSALVAGSRRSFWLLMATGLAVVAVGDTINLFSNSLGASKPGSIMNAVAWPTATLLMSLAPWQRAKPLDITLPKREPGLALPAMAAVCALGIVCWGSLHQVARVGLALAIITLVVTGVRMAASVRALRTISAQRHQLSLTDDLTGLRNRRYLSSLLEDYYAVSDSFTSTDRDMAFLFVDLNRFKEVNDSFGHPAGDELLRQLGPRFRGCLRANDVLVRLGGDEFALVLVGADSAYAADVAQRLNSSLEQPFLFQSVKLRIGASIGIAMASKARDATELLWCADVAMFQAKQSGLSYTMYEDDRDWSDRLQLVEELRSAIESNQLVLYYQPQMDFHTGAVRSVEALLRWIHPELGVIPPMQFIPLAEEAGLMQQVTEFVLDRALGQAAAWDSTGRHLAVSVNISAGDLLREGFADTVRELIARHDVPPDRLVLEITETSVIDNLVGTCRVVEELKKTGIVISLDDFGAGATSLAHLSNLGVGELKLDRSFITALSGPERRRVRELIHATIELGHAMGLRVVAEGIEDKATLDLVAELGCDVAQGYYISMPKPAEELAIRAEQPATAKAGLAL